MKALSGFLLVGVLVSGFGCMEPPQTNKMEGFLDALADLNKWDKLMMGKGYPPFDAVMGWGPEIWPNLINRVTDETESKIQDEISGRKPKICDMAFLMLLELMHKKWQDFSVDGVFVSTALDNPIFCIKWDRQTKFKVKARFLYFLEIDPSQQK